MMVLFHDDVYTWASPCDVYNHTKRETVLILTKRYGYPLAVITFQYQLNHNHIKVNNTIDI